MYDMCFGGCSPNLVPYLTYICHIYVIPYICQRSKHNLRLPLSFISYYITDSLATYCSSTKIFVFCLLSEHSMMILPVLLLCQPILEPKCLQSHDLYYIFYGRNSFHQLHFWSVAICLLWHVFNKIFLNEFIRIIVVVDRCCYFFPSWSVKPENSFSSIAGFLEKEAVYRTNLQFIHLFLVR